MCKLTETRQQHLPEMKYFVAIILFAVFVNTLSAQDVTVTPYHEYLNLKYYQGPDHDSLNHFLNLLIPDQVTDPPILVWIGGGAWSKVNRHVEMDLAGKFAAEGIAVATIGHRLSTPTWSDSTLTPGVKHPQHIIDVARAVKFLSDNAEKYGFSSQQVFVGGFSSGAQLAALLAMNDEYIKQQGLPEDLIKGVIPVSGTFDIPHYHQILEEGLGADFANRHIESVFGLSPQAIIDASPTSFLQGFDTPMLLISDRDMLRYHLFFEEKLREADIRNVQAINLLNYGHGDLWRHLSHEETSRYRDTITHFIKQDDPLIFTQ